MRKIILLVSGLLACFSGTVMAQNFRVEGIKKVTTKAPMGAFHPVFTPDGKNLLVSAEDYTGLAVVNLENPGYKLLTLSEGAGYKPAISEDGTTVITRVNHLDEQTMDLVAIDLQTAKSEMLVAEADHSNTITFNRGSINFSQNGKLRAKGVASRRLRAASTPVVEEIFLTEEDLKPVIYRNGVPTVIDPLSTPDNDVNYCWSSLSPDKKKMVFVAGKYTYTCNIDGSDLKNIGEVRAPQWRDNDYVVGMNDIDDGHSTTASDIVIVKRDGTAFQQLTTASDEIKMFPAVSPDGNSIAFHTTMGEIYLINISENK